MPITRDNGIQVPVNSDAWALAADLSTMADKSNVATVCANQAARDALTAFSGRLVIRLDLGGVIEIWDGSTWRRVQDAVAPVATVTGASGWNLTGQLVRNRVTTGTQVSASFMCTYGASAGSFAIGTTFIKALTLNNAGYIPSADIFGYVLVLSTANVVRADGAFNVNPSGEIWIRMFSGSYTVVATDKFYISGVWNA